jgi:hypothetical protein
MEGRIVEVLAFSLVWHGPAMLIWVIICLKYMCNSTKGILMVYLKAMILVLVV